MIRFRDRNTRGHHKGAWVESFHSFSFGDYVDPKHMGFRSLRVLNEDRVVPGAGFPEHDHHDTEIVTVVLEGALAHKDSLGNGSVIEAGDVQRLSAGTGVSHSETNPSGERRTHFLQIWIIPERTGLAPSYEQKSLLRGAAPNVPVTIASPDGRDGSLSIRQDAVLHFLRLDEGGAFRRDLDPARGYWVQMVAGIAALNGTEMRVGDGAAMTGEASLEIDADTDAEVLVFDLR